MNAAVAVPLTIAGLFVLELFTHHATPYTEKNLPEDLVGTWSGTGVVRVIPETDEQIRVPVTLTVHDNGSVSGTIGNATVRNLTAQKNRWWLYRKIGFYTDHLIEGRLKGDIESDDGLSGELVRMPCNIKDGKLCGTIFHMNGLKYNPIVNRLALSRESSGDVEEP